MFDVKGDRAQWRTVYDYLSSMNVGDVVKHDELSGLLPDSPASSVGSAFRRAVQECETQNRRTFASVRGVGYKMVDANEHERLARGHHKRAKRQLKTAKRKASSADRSRLTREERARIDAVELNLSRQIEMTNRLEARVAKVENDLKTARREQSSEAAVLNERLERVERFAESMKRLGYADANTQT